MYLSGGIPSKVPNSSKLIEQEIFIKRQPQKKGSKENNNLFRNLMLV